MSLVPMMLVIYIYIYIYIYIIYNVLRHQSILEKSKNGQIKKLKKF